MVKLSDFLDAWFRTFDPPIRDVLLAALDQCRATLPEDYDPTVRATLAAAIPPQVPDRHATDAALEKVFAAWPTMLAAPSPPSPGAPLAPPPPPRAPGPSTSSIVSENISGLAWIMALLLFATWLTVGTLSNIQFTAEIIQSYKITMDELYRRLDQIRQNQQKKADAVEDLKGYLAYMQRLDGEWRRHLSSVALVFSTSVEDVSKAEWRAENCPSDPTKRRPGCDELADVWRLWEPYQLAVADKNKKIDSIDKQYEAMFDQNEALGKAASQLMMRLQFIDLAHYNWMTAMPTQTLILVLAMSMGILGSLITMSWDFLKADEKMPFSWYFLRPFLGALSAIVMFVIAKATQMTISAGTPEVTLDPFFISGLGIAAGLLSDSAYGRMTAWGEQVLGRAGVERDRWSSHLKEALDKAGLTVETLAQRLGIDAGHLGKVIEERDPASPEEQRRIADSLNIARRLLFTDIAPD